MQNGNTLRIGVARIAATLRPYTGRHRAIELPIAQQRIAVPASRPAALTAAPVEQQTGTAVIA